MRDQNTITRPSAEPGRGTIALEAERGDRGRAMKKHVVIVGAGFAGLELATRLSESLRDAVHVTLIDRNDSFYFGFSKLDVLLGRQAPTDVLLHYRDIANEGVEFRQATVTAIDPLSGASSRTRAPTTPTSSRWRWARTTTWRRRRDSRQRGFEYYSLAGAERLRDALADFTRGRVLISVLGHPFKCPPAPFEGAFLLHDLLAKRGVRDAVDIRMTFPMAAPVPVTKEVSQLFFRALDERGIQYAPKELVVGLDPRARTARLASGGTMPYDLFIGIPVHRVPAVVNALRACARRLGARRPDEPRDSLSWRVRAGRRRQRGPHRRQGRDIRRGRRARRRRKTSPHACAARESPPPYEGDGPCYVEFGGGMVGKVEVNFLGGPAPTARIIAPSRELAAEKEAFAATRRQSWFGPDADAPSESPRRHDEISDQPL